MNVGHDIIHETFGSAPRTGGIWTTGRSVLQVVLSTVAGSRNEMLLKIARCI